MALVFLCSTLARAGVWPPGSEGDIRIPELVGRAAFVCKGEVTSAPQRKTAYGMLPRKTAVAIIRIDRCFKGKLEGEVAVASDEYMPAGGWSGGGHLFIPKVGEYLLLFLVKKDNVLDLLDQDGLALPVSRLTSTNEPKRNILASMEKDFTAGLNDPDPELVLKSILWLGCMQHLHSTAKLHALFEHSDQLGRLYIWESLLKLGDLSVVHEVADYFDQDPPDFRPLFLPRDRILQLKLRVFLALFDLRDASVIPYLNRFMDSADPHIRSRALMALRAIGSLDSAPVFLRELDNRNDDMAFIAMQALFELAGGGPIDWVENDPNLWANAPSYAQQCREWWSTEGEARARARFSASKNLQNTKEMPVSH